MLCSKLHFQKSFNPITFSYQYGFGCMDARQACRAVRSASGSFSRPRVPSAQTSLSLSLTLSLSLDRSLAGACAGYVDAAEDTNAGEGRLEVGFIFWFCLSLDVTNLYRKFVPQTSMPANLRKASLSS